MSFLNIIFKYAYYYHIIIIFVVASHFYKDITLMNRSNYFVVLSTVALLLLGLGESLYGWLQLLDVASSNHARYPSTGTFYNPGPFCGFLALLSPLALFHILNKANRVLYMLSCAYLVVAVTLMPSLMGRTGWIAAVAGSVYVMYLSGKIRTPKPSVLFGGSVVLVVLGILLFFMKPMSALGRFLIWRNGVSAMMQYPVTGVGWDNVAGALGDAQERFFEAHPDSILGGVAGAPEYAFNEFLQIGIAYGIVVLCMFILVLLFSIKWSIKSGNYGIAGSLSAFIVICLSSYPLQFPEYIICVGLMTLMSISICGSLPVAVKVLFSTVIVSLTVGVSIGLNIRKDAISDWNKAKYIYQYRLNDRDCHQLDSLAYTQGWNAGLLFDYGKALRQKKMYEKSNSILFTGSRCSSDPMFFNLMGRNFHDMGNFDRAEYFLRRSVTRLPGRMYPYYLLAKLYADSAFFDPEKFQAVYSQVMNMKTKIESPATRQMKEELHRMCDSIAEVSEEQALISANS